MYQQVNRPAIRRRARYRVRKKISGSAECPRLAVFRSLKHIYAQAIDDESGRTLAHASTQQSAVGQGKAGGNLEAAKAVGTALAESLKQAGIERAVFDRGGYLFHGRIKALADAVREGGVKF